MIVLRKNFSKYDETDAIKQMKDSDILAENRRKQNVGREAANAGSDMIKGAVTGGLAGGAVGYGLKTLNSQGKLLKRLGKGAAGIKGGAIAGAIAGASLAGLKAANKVNKQANENSFYNSRLAAAQRQAVRRERKDWKNNINNREGYTY